MSLIGGAFKRVCASTSAHKASIGGGIFRRQYHGVMATTGINVGSTKTPGSTQQPQNFHHQQRRHFAKGGDDDLAMKKQSPAAKKKKSAAASDGPSEEALAGNKTYKMLVASLDARVTKPPPASDEEMERRKLVGKNYVVGKFEQHNALEHDLSCKIRLKNHAIKMMPKHSLIRNAAMEIDDEGPPKWRHIPVWTPPIPGFDSDDFREDGPQER